MYKNATNFCMLMAYPTTLLSFPFTLIDVFVDSWDFLYIRSCHTWMEIVLLLLLQSGCLLSLSCLIALARTSRMMFSKGDDLALLPMWGESIQSSPLSMMIAMLVSDTSLTRFCPSLWSDFMMEENWILWSFLNLFHLFCPCWIIFITLPPGSLAHSPITSILLLSTCNDLFILQIFLSALIFSSSSFLYLQIFLSRFVFFPFTSVVFTFSSWVIFCNTWLEVLIRQLWHLGIFMICWWSLPAAAKSLQLCLTLGDPIDGSPPGSPNPGILQARTLEWVAISFSNAWKWKVKVKSLSRVRLLATPWTAAHQTPLSMGLSRQEYWSGVPLPSPDLFLGKLKFSWFFVCQVILDCILDI